MTFARLFAEATKPKPAQRQVQHKPTVYRNYEELFAQGRAAFVAGTAMHDGPYELAADHTHYDAWVDGWQFAQESQQHGISQ